MKTFLITVLLAVTLPVMSAPSWYKGKIKRIWPYGHDGTFIVTYEGDSSLSDCKHKYAYFTPKKLSEKALENSYALALSAFHTTATVGIVIDKDEMVENDGQCRAFSIDLRK